MATKMDKAVSRETVQAQAEGRAIIATFCPAHGSVQEHIEFRLKGKRIGVRKLTITEAYEAASRVE